MNSLAGFILEKIFAGRDYPGRLIGVEPVSDEPCEMPHVMGACFLVRSELYREAGGLDERFFIYREETDLCRRFREKGWKIYYLPALRIMHYGGGGKRETRRARFQLLTGVESEWLYHCKHHGLLAGWILAALNVLCILLSLAAVGVLYAVFYFQPKRRDFFLMWMQTHLLLLYGFFLLLFGIKPGPPR
jgi:GT2 family glycosyltransferase